MGAVMASQDWWEANTKVRIRNVSSVCLLQFFLSVWKWLMYLYFSAVCAGNHEQGEEGTLMIVRML